MGDNVYLHRYRRDGSLAFSVPNSAFLFSSCSFLNGMMSPTRWFYIALTEVELNGNGAY